MVKKLNILIIAFRNLFRHKVKSILTGIAIVIGVSLYIFLDAMLLGAHIDSERNLVNFETGAAKIYSKNYFENKEELPLYESFGNYEPIIKKLDEAGYNSTPRVVFTGMLMSTDVELPFMFIGIDRDSDKKVFLLDKYIESGEFVKNQEFGIVLGSNGARDLNINVGDDVSLSTVIDLKDEKGIIRHVNQLIYLKVIGIIKSPNPKVNGKIGYLPLDILQDKQGILLEGKITEICIRKKDTSISGLPGESEYPEVIAEKIKEVLPDNLIVVSWEDDAVDFLSISRTKRGGSGIIIILLFIITIILISNTMLLAVFERTKEIGMMRALGLKDKQIVRLFMIEAGLIGFISSLFGVLTGIIINYFMVKYGIDWTAMLEQANMENIGYRIAGEFKSAWNWSTIIFSGIGATIVASISAYFPAKRAVKMSIVDTLRNE
ncbi:MAG: ABC transporter permease [Spirochaetes bacterium]|nr:ABC transporter permease [Spirochaetota bacterium]